MDKIDLVLQGNADNYTIEIAESYSSLDFVNTIIISCWHTNFIDNLIQSPKIKIIKSEDVSFAGLGNRNRQIKSSLEGLKKVSTDFSVKMRSDQKISLDSMQLMFDFYNKNKEQKLYFADGSKPNNQICVAGIFKQFPFHPTDHIFWGNTQDLINIFNIIYDNISEIDNHNYNKYTRAETYIGSWYSSKFDTNILSYINNPTQYLIDNAANRNEVMDKSNYYFNKIFKSFPKISLDWPKYGNENYRANWSHATFSE